MAEFPTTITLPEIYERLIGQVIVRGAHAEWLLMMTDNEARKQDPKYSRDLTDRAHRVDYLGNILASAKHKKLPYALTPDEQSELDTMLRLNIARRDQLAHGVWMSLQGEKSPCVQITREDQPNYKKELELPQAFPVTEDYLRKVVARLEKIIAMVNKLRAPYHAALYPHRNPDLAAKVGEVGFTYLELGSDGFATPASFASSASGTVIGDSLLGIGQRAASVNISPISAQVIAGGQLYTRNGRLAFRTEPPNVSAHTRLATVVDDDTEAGPDEKS